MTLSKKHVAQGRFRQMLPRVQGLKPLKHWLYMTWPYHWCLLLLAFWWRSKVAQISAPKIPKFKIPANSSHLESWHIRPCIGTLSARRWCCAGTKERGFGRGDRTHNTLGISKHQKIHSRNQRISVDMLVKVLPPASEPPPVRIHSRAQRRTGRDVIATHHDPRGDVEKARLSTLLHVKIL